MNIEKLALVPYSDDLKFIQSLLDCDEKMQRLLEFVSSESAPGRSRPDHCPEGRE